MTQLPQRRLHLPHPSENLLYILALALSPIGNYLLQMLVLGQYQKALGEQRIWLHGAIDASYALFLGGTIPALFTLLLRTGVHRSADIRRVLGGFGIACSLDLLLNIIIVNLAIVDIKLQSYDLLLQAFVLYLSMNMIFFFWYWYFDHPLRLISADAHSAEKPRLPLGILFPEEAIEDVRFHSADWIPGPIDYLYFTAVSSNCFAAPEGHLLIGSKLKTLQLIHSSSMILVFIVILARAINTLG
jgi:hypothetical protein